MIVKATRGVNAQAALRYDYGPGRSMEHQNARRVAGTVPGRDWRERARGMQRSLRDAGDTAPGGPRRVFRLAVSAAPEDRVMSDRDWANIAERVVGEFTHRDPHGYQWEAVRHDPRHIHITLLHRGDDGRVFKEGLYKRNCLRIAAGLERDYDLRRVDRDRARTPEEKERRRAAAAAARRKQRSRSATRAPERAAPDRQPLRPRRDESAPNRADRMAAALEEAQRREQQRQQRRARDAREREREGRER